MSGIYRYEGFYMAKQAKLTILNFLRPFLYLALAQVVILLFLSMFYGNDTNKYECESATITVEDKYLVDIGTRRHPDKDFYVIYEGEKYQFSESVYSAYMLDITINIGDKIDVLYTKQHSRDKGDYYRIVDARYGDNIYADIDEYNKSSRIGFVIMSITCEVFWVLATAMVVLNKKNEFNDFIDSLKNKINKN